ncbi:hypothetical protein AMR72_15260 [Flavobacterium psychrophilum]|nr:hypothetical protein AMR72_15260 [Flavobacterium psychrophilum]AOE54440.1 hypothetical protein ALW18_15250 [Flavobacterium psychrophilum]
MVNIHQQINKFIASKWIEGAKSIRSFAVDHGIDEKTARRIADSKDNYKIGIETLNKICEAREIKLSDFFKEIGL